jgi:hypothetical protein
MGSGCQRGFIHAADRRPCPARYDEEHRRASFPPRSEGGARLLWRGPHAAVIEGRATKGPRTKQSPRARPGARRECADLWVRPGRMAHGRVNRAAFTLLMMPQPTSRGRLGQRVPELGWHRANAVKSRCSYKPLNCPTCCKHCPEHSAQPYSLAWSGGVIVLDLLSRCLESASVPPDRQARCPGIVGAIW